MKIEAGAIKGLADFLDAAPEAAKKAASMAMNDITGGAGLKAYKTAMQAQIGFPAGYLDDTERFGQTGFASPDRLETKIKARQRPTSLARFASGGTIGQAGVTVTVKNGRPISLKGAFMVRLRAGTDTADGFNVGIAVRVKPGQMIRNKKDASNMVRLAPNVYLLYAPSVDQVFKDVADTETPAVLDLMATEFLRQFTRLAK